MIVTDHFVYIHVSRTGGTFLNRLIMQHLPGARMIRYHGKLEDLPAEFDTLPVIGFIRNPWDWYVSMFFDYRRKGQFVFRILSDRRALGFGATVARFLNLGDGSDASKELLQQLVRIAPQRIDKSNPVRDQLPGLTAAEFSNYPADVGYFTFLFRRMFESPASENAKRSIHIGRFENLRNETLRLFELTGTPISNDIVSYLESAAPLNSSPRPKSVAGHYSPQLQQLVADRDRSLIEEFDYRLPTR